MPEDQMIAALVHFDFSADRAANWLLDNGGTHARGH